MWFRVSDFLYMMYANSQWWRGHTLLWQILYLYLFLFYKPCLLIYAKLFFTYNILFHFQTRALSFCWYFWAFAYPLHVSALIIGSKLNLMHSHGSSFCHEYICTFVVFICEEWLFHVPAFLWLWAIINYQ